MNPNDFFAPAPAKSAPEESASGPVLNGMAFRDPATGDLVIRIPGTVEFSNLRFTKGDGKKTPKPFLCVRIDVAPDTHAVITAEVNGHPVNTKRFLRSNSVLNLMLADTDKA